MSEYIQDCKFSFSQKVKISKGFLGGKVGVVEEVSRGKDGVYKYDLKLLSNNKVVKGIEEHLLRKLNFFEDLSYR